MSRVTSAIAYAVALHMMYYNFVRIHQKLRAAPAMAATLRSWSRVPMRWPRNAGLIVGAFLLANLSLPASVSGAGITSQLCITPRPDLHPDDKEDQPYYAVLACSIRNADLLAGGPDSADAIAVAASDLCNPKIAAVMLQGRGDPHVSAEEIEAQTRKRAISEARIEVLRRRAGRCPQTQ